MKTLQGFCAALRTFRMSSRRNAFGDGIREVWFLVAVAILAAEIALPQHLAKDRDKTYAQFVITDGWGGPVRSAIVNLIPRTGSQMSIRYPQQRSLIAEAGTYTVIVEAQGFQILAKPI